MRPRWFAPTRDEVASLIGGRTHGQIVQRGLREMARGFAALADGHVISAGLHVIASASFGAVAAALMVFPETREP